MSTQRTYKIGERVRVVRPFNNLKAGQIVTIEGFECTDGVAYVDIDGHGANWDLNRFEGLEPDPDTDSLTDSDTVTEPEDADDVEPEPLKEGDWHTPIDKLLTPEDPDRVTINTLDREEIDRFARALPAHWSLVNEDDTIDSEVINDLQAALREFATPKPTQCASMIISASLDSSYWRCSKNEHADNEPHESITGERWGTDVEHGRITDGGAS